MNDPALIARVVLAIVFLVAATAKLADLESSRDTVEAFGIPRRAARIAGTLLPVVEAVCGVALLLQPSGRWAALAGLLLLGIFSGGVAVALANGRTPSCNCFGQVSSEAISWRTLARNAVLAAVALFAVAAGPGSSLSAWTGNLELANVLAGVLCVAAALAALTILNLYLRNRDLRGRLAEALSSAGPPALSPGVAAPEFVLPDIAGAEVALRDLCARGRAVLLVFASPVCGPCQFLLPQLSRWSSALSESLTIAVIESGVPDPGAIADQFESRGEMVVLVEDGFATPERYSVAMTPTALLVDAHGTIQAPATTGGQAIEKLVRSALRQSPTPEFA